MGAGVGASRPDRRATCRVSETAQVTASEPPGRRHAAATRLDELGIELPKAATALGAYVPAVRTGNLVYTSGQLPLAGGDLIRSGKVGGDVSPEEAKSLARGCALNALAAVDGLVGLDAIT